MIKAGSVSLTYQKKRILNSITADISGSAVTGIIGPSGSGKSLFLQILAGRIKPSSGSLSISGMKFPVFPPKKILYDNAMTLMEYVRHNQFSTQQKTGGRISAFCDIMGISSHINKSLHMLPDSIIRCGLIIASLAVKSDGYFLDCPESSIGPVFQNRLIKLLKYISVSEKVPVCIVCGEVNFFFAATNRFIALKEGSVTAQGQTGKITSELIEKLYDIEIIFQKNVFTGNGECSFFNQV